jgi:TatA/E family protein of Tat protein translocase
MSISGTEWLVILAVIVLVFGRTQVLQLMGDAGRGLTNFRADLADLADPADPGPPPPTPGA